MEFDRKQLLLYAITDRACIGQRDFDRAVEEALTGGVTILQLREKHLSNAELVSEAKRIKKICARYHVPLIVNDNYRAAIEAGADGVHVGITDAPVAEIRRIAGAHFIIGATAKTVGQAQLAESAGADYLGVGAVFPSPTKTDALRITPAQFREIARSVKIPAVAIGGISQENLPELAGIGAAGAAVVSAVFSASDITARCRLLKSLAEQIISA
ncbi:MAG: thiamine phosphate synthase [Oscillospiraceae bacterium]|nr:thiamine phosphate synthase [Oscillospiraceae bacterium]